MAKLRGNLSPRTIRHLQGSLDIYHDKRTGLIARGWPKYAVPTPTPAWQATADAMRRAWEDIRQQPPEAIERWKKYTQGGQKTAYDSMRSASLAAPAGRVRLAYPTEAVTYIDEDGTYYAAIHLPTSATTAEQNDDVEYQILLADTIDDLCPTWLPGPPPPCRKQRRRIRNRPSWQAPSVVRLDNVQRAGSYLFIEFQVFE